MIPFEKWINRLVKWIDRLAKWINRLVKWIDRQIEKWLGKAILISAYAYFGLHMLVYFLFK